MWTAGDFTASTATCVLKLGRYAVLLGQLNLARTCADHERTVHPRDCWFRHAVYCDRQKLAGRQIHGGLTKNNAARAVHRIRVRIHQIQTDERRGIPRYRRSTKGLHTGIGGHEPGKPVLGARTSSFPELIGMRVSSTHCRHPSCRGVRGNSESSQAAELTRKQPSGRSIRLAANGRAGRRVGQWPAGLDAPTDSQIR